MLKIYRNDAGKCIKVMDNDKALHFALLDDTMIELHCSLDEIEKQILEGIEGEIRYDIEAEELSFLSSETISFLLLEVRNNNIKLIGSIDMVAQVLDYKWSLNDYVCELKRQLQYYSDIELNYYELGEEAFMWLETEINTNISLHESICIFYKKTEEILSSTKIALDTFFWKEEYLVNEKMFCGEILTPLFRHMGYDSVMYNHGVNEFGKDYILTETTKINTIRYYGVQVKAGNVEGGVNSQIDNILYQIRDAFDMPFYLKNHNQQCYISELFIIVSGKYTLNAKEKIRNKLCKTIFGNVYFLDKEDIQNLMTKYWKK